MAPKSSSRPLHPHKDKEERKKPTQEEEEEEDETDSEPEEEQEEEEKTEAKDQENESDSSTEEEEEEEDEEEEDEEDPIKTPNPPPKPSSKPGSDSETESDNFKVQPVAKPSTAKRNIQEIVNGESSSKSKKPKSEPKKPASASASTPSAFVRVWSNKDEIALLKGMAEFKALKGKSPNSDMEGFFNFVKGKLQVDFSKEQLRTKIRRMNKRYMNGLKKGSDPVFSNPHEDMLFKLSKKVWGGGDGNNQSGGGKESKNAAKSGGKKERKVEILKVGKVDEGEKVVAGGEGGEGSGEGEFWSKYRFLDMSFRNVAGSYPSLAFSEGAMGLIKEKLGLVGDAKVKELNEKWKELIAEEAELNYKMLTLMREQIGLALDK